MTLLRLGGTLARTAACVAIPLSVAACADHAVISGFAPIYPPLAPDNFPETDSLTPTLQWEAFPGTVGYSDKEGPALFVTVHPGRVGRVEYDLRIWRAENEYPQEVVLDRRGIPEPSFTIEQPLSPDTVYLWSVRARFELDGEFRLSEWSLASYVQAFGPQAIRVLNRVRQAERIFGAIPPCCHYRFRTPPEI